MSKDRIEQFKPAHKVIDVVDRANKKICVILQRYSVDKPETSYAQVRLIARKKADEKFQKVVFVNYKREETIYPLDVIISVYQEGIAPYYFLSDFFLIESGDNRNFFLKLKSKLGLYHLVLTTPKPSPEKFTLTVVEMQQLPDI